MERFDEAVELLKQHSNLFQMHPDFHYYMGMALFNMGEFIDTIVHLERARTLSPKYRSDSDIAFAPGVAYAQRELPACALREFRSALKKTPNHPMREFANEFVTRMEAQMQKQVRRW